MKPKKIILIPIFVLALVALACGTSVVKDTPVPTVDQAATDAVAASTSTAQSIRSTQTAMAIQLQGTSVAQTQAVNQALTEIVADMYSDVQWLYSNDLISTTNGTYSYLGDFDESVAQIGYLTWWNTGYTPSNFVVRTNVNWDTASRTSNWFETGCGFVFRAEDNENFYFVFLALDGNVYLRAYVNNVFRDIGKGYYGRVDYPVGSADFILAVDGNKISFLVNDQVVLTKTDSNMSFGDLALTVFSGTNKDYGTRCQMNNIELWELP